jgi:hypothetical protein
MRFRASSLELGVNRNLFTHFRTIHRLEKRYNWQI